MPAAGARDAVFVGSSTHHHFWAAVCQRATAYGCRQTDRHCRSQRKRAAAPATGQTAVTNIVDSGPAAGTLADGTVADEELDVSKRPVMTFAFMIVQDARRLAASGPPPTASGVQDAPAEAAVTELWKHIRGAKWYMDVATGSSRPKPVHLTMLRMAFNDNASEFLEAAENEQLQAQPNFSVHAAAHAVALLRLVYACHRESLLECDAALLMWRRLAGEPGPSYRKVLKAGGHVIELALKRMSALFHPESVEPLLGKQSVLTNRLAFTLRVSPCARIAGHCGALSEHHVDVEAALLSKAGVALLDDGYAVLEDVFDASAVASMAAEVESMDVDTWAQATLKVFTETERSRTQDNKNAAHRGDRIWWLDGGDKHHPLLSALAQWLRHNLGNGLRKVLCESGKTSRFTANLGQAVTIERSTLTLPHAMLACYPGGGAKFTAHLDNDTRFPDNRIISAVFYLNEDWRPEYGGALRIRKPNAPGIGSLLPGSAEPPPPEAILDVQPVRNTLVLFWSNAVEHEVLPAWQTRYAVSMWLRTAKEELTSPFIGRNARSPDMNT